MMNVKKTMLLAAVAALLLSVCLVSGARGTRSAGSAPADTLVVNTTELCKDVIGYDGPTPLLIKVVNGGVVKGGLLKAVVGKKVDEAAKMQLDAVSGATYSSEAVIANLRAGLAAAATR